MSVFRSFALSLAGHALVAGHDNGLLRTSVMLSPNPPQPDITVDYGGAIGRQKSLYEQDGDLYNLSPQELDIATLSSGKFRGCDVWHVAFYNDGCPWCQRDAPKSKRLASAFANQKKLCFGVFNCNLEGDFWKKCSSLGVQRFPTKWFFNLHLPANPPDPTPTKHEQYSTVYRDPDVQASYPKVDDVAWWYSQITTAERRSVKELDQSSLKPHDWPPEAFGQPNERMREGMRVFASELRKRMEHLSQDTSWSRKRGRALRLLNILQRGFSSGEQHVLFAQLDDQVREKSFTESRDPTLFKDPPRHLLKQTSSATWTVFHALSFTAIQPADMLEFVHTFVYDFFPCTMCRSHFLRMWDSGDPKRSDIRTAEDVQYYVWTLHNKVNVRVGDASRMWPPHASCPACYNDADKPVRAAILRFLKETYVEESSAGQNISSNIKDPGSHLMFNAWNFVLNMQELPSASSKSWMLNANVAMWLIAVHACLW